MMLAASCAAENENQSSDNESMALWWNEFEDGGQGENGFADEGAFTGEYGFTDENEFMDDYFDIYSYYEEAPQDEPLNLAFPVDDLNGDSASDILVLTISSGPDANEFSTAVSAMSGSDGIILWEREYSDGFAIPYPAEDLNGDGLSDVIMNTIIAGMSSLPYSELSALNGYDGTEIWSRPHFLAITFAYPMKDAAGDNATDLIEHLFGIDSINGSLVTKISAVDGSSGTEIASEIFPGAIAVEYPAGNFTDDHVQDSITAAYLVDENMPNSIASAISAKSGSDGTALWNISFDESLAIAIPVEDITGDGLDDLIVYIVGNDTEVNFEMAAVQGSDGQTLWKRSSGESLAIAFVGPDLTGEGTKDLIVYKLDEFEGGETQAVKGDDGSTLWTQPLMIFIPQ